MKRTVFAFTILPIALLGVSGCTKTASEETNGNTPPAATSQPADETASNVIAPNSGGDRSDRDSGGDAGNAASVDESYVRADLNAAEADDEVEKEVIPNQHSKPIVNEDGRTLLWAREDADGKAEWFDMTDALIDPVRFQFGIGKDRIPSIDEPEFLAADDARLAARGVTRETPVLGVYLKGEARAYPVAVLDMHEVVNDEFAGEPYAVLW